MIIEQTKDIWDYPFDIIVIPVNCVGVAGSGIALQIKKNVPNWYQDYKEECEKKNKRNLQPGRCIQGIYKYKDREIQVISAAVKDSWMNLSNYDYIKDCSVSIVQELYWSPRYIRSDPLNVAIPAIGCGLGGLEWNRVKPILLEQLDKLDNNYEVTLFRL